MNKEEKRIKAAMAPVCIDETAFRIATILGCEQPTPQPILLGLVEETMAKKKEDMEHCIQLLEIQNKYTILPSIPSLEASTIPSKHSMINLK